jgi:hypothetical protein
VGGELAQLREADELELLGAQHSLPGEVPSLLSLQPHEPRADEEERRQVALDQDLGDRPGPRGVAVVEREGQLTSFSERRLEPVLEPQDLVFVDEAVEEVAKGLDVGYLVKR